MQVNFNAMEVRKQLQRFFVTGVTAVLTDTLVYFLLLNWYEPSLAKMLSFLSGTCVSYILNKFWTFEKKKHSSLEIVKFIVLYGTTLGVNVLVNTACLMYFTPNKLVAFIMATGTSTVLNFIGQKWWVFRK